MMKRGTGIGEEIFREGMGRPITGIGYAILDAPCLPMRFDVIAVDRISGSVIRHIQDAFWMT